MPTRRAASCGPVLTSLRPVVFALLAASCGSPSTAANPSLDTDLAANAPDSGVLADAKAAPEYRWLEVADDPASIAAVSCEGETAPGADIDAVERYTSPAAAASGQVDALLADCRWHTVTARCPQATGFEDATQAAGAADTDGLSGFVSLNGGSIICRWSAGSLALGNLVKVREVGSNDRYRVRACTDASAETCGAWHTVQKADATIPAGALLP